MSKGISPEANPPKNSVVLIAGPTASGKSDLAVQLAGELADAGLNSVVINADSAQVYRDLRILSARPADDEMAGVPHRLFGTWDGAQPCSAADWAAAARAEIASAHRAGAVPILVGGTGLYISTLLDGISPIPAIDEGVREDVRALGTAAAYAALQEEDPERAAVLAPGDSQRIARSLEVVRSTGQPLAFWQQNKTGGIGDQVSLIPLVLLPGREEVYARCDARFAQMLENGALEEVQTLLDRDLDPDLPVMRAIGVPEVTALLRGRMSREEALEAGQQATRNYAKRQFTWLRNQFPQDWPRIEPENVAIRSHFERLFP